MSLTKHDGRQRAVTLIKSSVAKWKSLAPPFGSTADEVAAMAARRKDLCERIFDACGPVILNTTDDERFSRIRALAVVLSPMEDESGRLGVPEPETIRRKLDDEVRAHRGGIDADSDPCGVKGCSGRAQIKPTDRNASCLPCAMCADHFLDHTSFLWAEAKAMEMEIKPYEDADGHKGDPFFLLVAQPPEPWQDAHKFGMNQSIPFPRTPEGWAAMNNARRVMGLDLLEVPGWVE